jgi:hypothetical protein
MTLKGLSLLATALAGTIAFAAPASAQMRHVEETRTTTRVVEHRDHMRHPRRKVCTVRWVHHHKVRRCFWR